MKYTRSLCALLGVAAFAQAPDQVFNAIRDNNLLVLKSLSKEQANARGKNDTTPLTYAASFGSLEAIRILLDAGADVNAKDARDATPLLLGAWDSARTRLFVEKGADVNARSKMGRTALSLAAGVEGNFDVVKLLLEKGADPKADNSAALVNAASHDLAMTRLLLDRGADVNAAAGLPRGVTPLMEAAASTNTAIVKLLLARGANVNAASVTSPKVRHGDIALRNLTALMFAAPYGSQELMKTLIDAGANVNARDIRGMTPLMLAVANDRQNASAISTLIAKGADVNARSEAGETVLNWARKFGNPEIIQMLEKRGAKGSGEAVNEGSPAPAANTRAAVERSLTLLQRSGSEFFKESGCAACHNVTTTRFALRSARAAGLSYDEKAAAELTRSVGVTSAPVAAVLLQRMEIGGTFDTAAFTLAGLAAAEYPADLTTDSFLSYLAWWQSTNGSWDRGFGIARVPMEGIVTGRTALAARAMQAYSWPARAAEFQQRIAKARESLLKAKPITSYGRAEQLLGLKWTGATHSDMAKIAKALLAEQKPDGGWAQNRYLASDAYATGMALWALHESGTARPADAAYRRGVEYLMRTQRADGSWFVRSRSPKFQPYFEGGFPYGHDQWISNAATAYAAMALAPAAGPAKSSIASGAAGGQ